MMNKTSDGFEECNVTDMPSDRSKFNSSPDPPKQKCSPKTL